MPDICVLVNLVNPDPGDVVRIGFVASVSSGQTIEGQTLLDFSAAAVITNAAIVAAARAAMTTVHGIVFAPTDRSMLFGGRV